MSDDIVLRSKTSEIAIRAARGGIATKFSVGGEPIFYLDEATLEDPTKNVRGGNPILFPSPGKLAGDRWKHGELKQHGFARNLPWRHVAGGTIELVATEETRRAYPWDFAVQLTYELRDRSVRIDQRIENRDAKPMPFGFGFHPYFFVGDKRGASIETKATRAYDNVAKREVPYVAPDFTAAEIDLHLIDHGRAESALVTSARTIRVRGSDEYTHWVAWTVAGKDYICLEPWTCPGDALNSGDRVIELAPGAARSLWIEIEV